MEDYEYVNEGRVLWKIKCFCKEASKKYIEAQAKRTVERYRFLEVGGNLIIYVYRKDDLQKIIDGYLEDTKTKGN